MDKQAWQAGLLLLAAASIDCRAAQPQRKEVRDGLTVEAIVSEREATRIRVEDGMITGVVGKIQSSTGCMGPDGPMPAPQPAIQPLSPTAEASITCDLSKGEIYLSPLGQGKKPINLFISTGRATYTLVLHKDDRPSETIVLFDPSAPRIDGHKGDARPRQAGHVKGIKTMLKAMLASRTPDDLLAEDVDLPLRLWQEASLRLVRTYRGRGFVGERYYLTNTSGVPMTLTEQEFDRDGEGVVAVAIDQLNLRPGDATWVYVIRRGGQP